jgi:hypothetical protein
VRKPCMSGGGSHGADGHHSDGVNSLNVVSHMDILVYSAQIFAFHQFVCTTHSLYRLSFCKAGFQWPLQN